MVHDPHPVSHRQRLLLVVRDAESGDAQSLLKRTDLLAQLQPHLGVEGGQRLVGEQHGGRESEGAGQSKARVRAAGRALGHALPGRVPGQIERKRYSWDNAGSLDPADQFLNSPRTRFTVSSAGSATLGGRATHAITLVPKRPNASFTSAKVWIDDNDSSIRQFDLETANGLKRHVVITSFTANPDLSRSSFRFAVPKGVKIVDQSTGAAF